MGRHSLSTVMALGAVISLLGGAGLFAVFTDRAITGQNSVIAGEQPHFEALQLASAELTPDQSVACGTYADDLSTPLVTLTNAQPSEFSPQLVCIANLGSFDLSLSATVIDLLESETGCTGDEGAFDPTCGIGEAGELATVLRATAGGIDCATSIAGPYTANLLGPLAAGASLSLGSLTAGSTACYLIGAWYPTWADPTDVQIAQSDQVSWRFAFDGTE